MKVSAFVVFIFVCLIPFTGCGRRDIDTRLSLADSLMAENPDSALAVLGGFDPNYASSGQIARYAVLLTEALYKNDLTPSDDSLINIAVRYYDREVSSAARMKAYYYRGHVCIQASDYGNAIVSMLNAERSAKLIGPDSSLWLGLIYRGIADAFDKIRDFSSARDYYHKSYNSFLDAPDNPYTIYALGDLARINMNGVKYQECIPLSDSLYNQAVIHGNDELREMAVSMKAISLRQLNKPMESMAQFDRLQPFENGFADPHDWLLFGLCCLDLGQIGNAHRANDSLLKHIPDEYYLLYHIKKKEGKFLESEKYFDKETFEKNNLYTNYVNRHYAKVTNDFYLSEVERSDQSAAASRRAAIYIVTIAALSISLLILLFYNYAKRNRDRLRNNMLNIENLKNSLEETHSRLLMAEKNASDSSNALTDTRIRMMDDISGLRNTVKDLVASEIDTLASICSEYYQHVDLPGKRDHINHQIKSIISDLGIDGAFTKRMADSVNIYMNNVYDRFRADFPKLSPDQYHLFLLLILGFPNRAISVIEDIRIENVYNRKTRLKNKIAESDSPYRQEYLDLIDNKK